MLPRPYNHLALISLLAVCAASMIARPASAQQPDHAATIQRLLPRAMQIETLHGEGDDWSHAYLRSEIIVELARLAVITGDQPTILATLEALLNFEKVFVEQEPDSFQLSYLQAVRCLLLAALGEGEQASELARQIVYLSSRAEAFNYLACFALDQGDVPAYTRLSLEADRLFELSLRADALKDEDDRLYVEYFAWPLLHERMRRVVDLDRHPEPAGELARWAEVYGGLPLEDGARAECLAYISYGFALIGDEVRARELLKLSWLDLAREQKKVEQAEEFDYPYGTEHALCEIVQVHAVLGEWEQAAQAIEEIPDIGMACLSRAVLAQIGIRRGNPMVVAVQITRVVDHLVEIEQAVTSPDHGPWGEGRDEDDQWYGYDSSSLYWDYFDCVRALSQSGQGDSIRQKLGERQTELAKLAIEVGVLSGQLQPAPAIEAE
ncbi:MAG: hypothetical protein AAGC44_06915 [Planctomycetota bacterium]